MTWFEVDKDGLEKQLARRSKSFVLFELIQNAWDQNVTRVVVKLKPIERQPTVSLSVEDDDPMGFSSLSDSFTLFAHSNKKTDPRKRGRFNLGEKLVLALCKEARIETTTGTVSFTSHGRKVFPHQKRPFGTKFSATLKMTRAEYKEICDEARRLIPPDDVITTFNDSVIMPRKPVREFEASLPTEIADDEGFLRPTVRRTSIRLYEVMDGEEASIYEMGIPIVATGDKWHVDISQKVILNTDRDNVPPKYLKTVRRLVLDQMYESITADDATNSWVKEAVSDPATSSEAVTKAVELRFGQKRVIFDPSDREANNIAVSKGYTVISGGTFNAKEWESIRRAGAALPAGQVTPSPKPFVEGGRPLRVLTRSDWSEGITQIANYSVALAKVLIGKSVTVQIANDRDWKFNACYGDSQLILNLARLGRRWFENGIHPDVDALLIHEFCHDKESNHLSHSYHMEICRLAARLAQSWRNTPEVFAGFNFTDFAAAASL